MTTSFPAWLLALFFTLLAAFVWSILPDDDDDNDGMPA